MAQRLNIKYVHAFADLFCVYIVNIAINSQGIFMEGVAPNIGTSLTGRILVSPPGIEDSRFRSALTLVIEHSEQGAIGLILNRPSLVPLSELIPDWEEIGAIPEVVFAGGPVDHDALIALGKSKNPDGELVLGAHSVDLDDQPALVEAEGIDSIRVFAGYAGWEPGQLEKEIIEDYWWLVDGEIEDIFSNEPAKLWSKVLSRQQSRIRWYAHYPVDIKSN